MMIEDLYKTTDKLNKHIENMALNKVNIEFLRGQMDKVLVDIEKLKIYGIKLLRGFLVGKNNVQKTIKHI